MCGIVGIVGQSPVNQQIYDALTVLQHRGQDAAGIMTCDEGELFMRKQNGLVRDVFQQRHMLRLKGNIGIGHVRYPTAGCDSSSEAQPFFVNSPVRHLPRAQRQSHECCRARRGADPRGSAPPQHRAPTRKCCSTFSRASCRAPGTPRASAADIFAAVTFGVSPRAWRFRSRVDDRRSRAARLPRPARHSPLVIGRRENAARQANTCWRPRA
jgi:amidophosphoribosyltransferase